MTDIIKTTPTRYEEYEALLIRRDHLRKEAGRIGTAYMRLFGRLITEIYEEKVECVRRKKAIVFCQAALNQGHKVKTEALHAYLEKEMTAYYENLDKLKADYETCRNAGFSTAYQIRRSKELYRRLVKALHPDLNPLTEKSPQLMDLWNRVITAYEHDDAKALSELTVLVSGALKALGEGEAKVDIPDIDDRIAGVNDEIERITTTEPYTLKSLVESEDATRSRTIELENELETWKNYKEELNATLNIMIGSGRIDLK